jgi:hypothetical protein
VPCTEFATASLLEEQDSFHTVMSTYSSGGSSTGGSVQAGRGWMSRLSRLRRRSSTSRGSFGGSSDAADVENSLSTPQALQLQQIQVPRGGLGSQAGTAAGRPAVQSAVAALAAPLAAAAKQHAAAPGQRPPSAFWELLHMVESEGLCFAVGGLGCLGHGAMMPAFAALLTSILAIFQLQGSEEMLQAASSYALALANVGVGACCCVTVQFYMFGAIGTRLARRLRVLLLGAILRQEIG